MASVDSGWSWVVLVASFSVSGMLFGLSKCAGILYTVLPQTYAISRSEAATITTLYTSIMCACGVMSGMLLSYVSNRQLVIIAGFVIPSGLFIASQATTATTFLIGYGIVLALGGGLSIVPSRMILMEYFDQKKNLAIGLSMTGSCVGGICIPPLMETLEEIYGLNGTMLIFSGVLLNVVPAAMTFIPQEPKKNQKLKTISSNIDDKKKLQKEKKPKQKCSCPLDFSVIFDFYFIAIVLSSCCSIMGFSSINLSFPDYAISELNSTRSHAALLLSATSIGDLVGRMLISLFSNKFPLKYLYICGILLSAAFSILITTISSFWALFACAVCYGLVTGTINVAPNLLINEYIMPKKWASAFALSTMFISIPIMVTAPLIASLRETLGSYVPCFHITGLVTSCASLPWILETFVKNKKKKKVYWIHPLERESGKINVNASNLALRSSIS